MNHSWRAAVAPQVPPQSSPFAAFRGEFVCVQARLMDRAVVEHEKRAIAIIRSYRGMRHFQVAQRSDVSYVEVDQPITSPLPKTPEMATF